MPNGLPKSVLDKIKNGSDKDLAELFAPVVYFADDEKWLPTDMESFYSVARLFKGSSEEPKLNKGMFREKRIPPEMKPLYDSIMKSPVPYGDLGTKEKKAFVLKFLKHGHDYNLNLWHFDIEGMRAAPKTGPVEHGSGAVRDAAIARLGNNKPGYKGCCYAKVRRLGRKVKFRSGSKKNWYNGSWIIIHYFFFYTFNYSTNVHEGDWDSSITVCINPDKERVYVTYNQHHTTWLTRLNLDSSLKLDKWLRDWTYKYDTDTGVWRDREPGLSFGMGPHRTNPVGIVASGSHGIYPTPGVIIFGISIPFKKDLPFTVDDRKLGFGIGPKGLTRTPAGFPNIKFNWDKIVLIEDELDDDPPKSPFAFKGHWGEVSPTRSGWDGPRSPLFSEIWSRCDRTGHFEDLLEKDYDGYKKRYSRGGVMLSNVMLNTHRL